jgi:hypothetical protein
VQPEDDLHRHQAEQEADSAVGEPGEQPVGAPLLDQQCLEDALLAAPARLRLQRAVQEARQLRQKVDEAWRLPLELLDQAAPADLLVHPALEEGLGGAPKVELWVELAAEALDSTWPSEMSFSGRSNCGSQTARIAPSSSSTRVIGGTQPLSTCSSATRL